MVNTRSSAGPSISAPEITSPDDDVYSQQSCIPSVVQIPKGELGEHRQVTRTQRL